MSRTREPRHIAMFAVPAHGHVNPSLAVISELAARGHRVTFAVTEQFAPQVEEAGATPVLYDTTWPTTLEAAKDQWSGDAVDAFEWFLGEAIHVLPQVAAAYEHDRPDLILYDIGGYPGRVLAHRWDLPVVQLSPTYVAWDGYEQEMAEALAPIRETPAYAAYERRFQTWLDAGGIALDPDAFSGRPDRCLVLIPRAMQPNADRVDPERYTFVGAAVDARAEQGGWEGPGDGRPVLLISLGSAFTDQPAFFRACIAAFGGLDWHVVMSIGGHVARADLGPIPANFEVAAFVPQVAVLEQASAFVTHAGMGSTKEGLAAGVPLVAVPQAVDQFPNAERIVELGVGRQLVNEEATPEALREAVLALAGDPEVAARLERIAAEIAAEGGAPRAADLIEELLTR